MKASDLFVRSLEQGSVEYMFGVPGGENLDFLKPLRTSTIRLILTRHEQAAGLMAPTYGRLTGKVGVWLATTGSRGHKFVHSGGVCTVRRNASSDDHRTKTYKKE